MLDEIAKLKTALEFVVPDMKMLIAAAIEMPNPKNAVPTEKRERNRQIAFHAAPAK